MADSKSDLLMKFVGPKGDLAAGGLSALTATAAAASPGSGPPPPPSPISPDDKLLKDFKRGMFFEVSKFSFGLELDEAEAGQEEKAPPAGIAGGKFINWRTRKSNQTSLDIQYPVDMDAFSITRTIDQASPVIFQNCANSIGFASAVLVKRRATGGSTGLRGFLRMDFTQVLVISVAWKDGSLVEETCKFRFRSLAVKYVPQASDGTVGSASGDIGAQWQPPMKLRDVS